MTEVMTDEELQEAQGVLEKMNLANENAQKELAACLDKQEQLTLKQAEVAVEVQTLRMSRKKLKEEYDNLYQQVGLEVRRRTQLENEKKAADAQAAIAEKEEADRQAALDKIAAENE